MKTKKLDARQLRVLVESTLCEAPGDEAALANRIDDAFAAVESDLNALIDLLGEANLTSVAAKVQFVQDEYDDALASWLDNQGGGQF